MTTLERDTIILNHLPFAQRLAKEKSRTVPKFVSLDELKSAAYYGLVQAADNYKMAFGVSFASHAAIRIKGSMCDYLRECSWGPRNCNTESVTLDWEIAIEDEDNFSEVVEGLESIQRKVLTLYYMEGFTLKEIGSKIGVKEARVSQILSQSKKTLAQTLQ